MNSAQLSWRYRMLFLFGLFTIGPMIFALLDPTLGSELGTCVVKQATGYECPGCGVTTSMVALLNGNLSKAINANQAGPLIATIVYGSVVYLLIVVSLKLRGFSWRAELKIFNALEIVSVIVLIIAWSIRIFQNLYGHDQLSKVLQTNEAWWF